ncbi:MAG: SMI1/KNR4 family protein [Deltaproteobacteria bacterium]|nr:SMI1/KNR4 family protein [Deltaproteobacteria bacterium]
MHRGVRELIQWAEKNNGNAGVTLRAPAQAIDLSTLEQEIGAPLPTDLRLVLGRFNGGQLPSSVLLTAAPGPGTTIDAALKQVAAQREASFLDPEVILPFARTEHGSVLAFDRTAAPISDTWPIVDYDPETGDLRLVHRTFDAWCRVQVSEWTASDFGSAFTLDRYLAQGQRHATVEPDVSVAHVTVGHALRRAGRPEEALASYLRGARCVPSEPWCDWEAIKLAVTLGSDEGVLEAGARLGKRAPESTWDLRGTTPSRVAYIVARAFRRVPREDPTPWLRILDHLILQTYDDDDRAACTAIREKSELTGETLPEPYPDQPRKCPPIEPPSLWWQQLQAAYHQGVLRDDDLALDPIYDSLPDHRAVELLRIRRDF